MIAPRYSGFAEPHAPGTVEMTSGGQKTYKGLLGWERRIQWFLANSEKGIAEPMQWRTSTGVSRCVRCGIVLTLNVPSRKVCGCLLSCCDCRAEVEAVDSTATGD